MKPEVLITSWSGVPRFVTFTGIETGVSGGISEGMTKRRLNLDLDLRTGHFKSLVFFPEQSPGRIHIRLVNLKMDEIIMAA